MPFLWNRDLRWRTLASVVIGSSALLLHGPAKEIYNDIRGRKLHPLNFYHKVVLFGKESGFLSDKAEVSTELQQLIDEAIAHSQQLTDSRKKQLNVVTNNVNTGYAVGCLRWPIGAKVNIPDYFNVTDYSQLHPEKIDEFLEKEFKWSLRAHRTKWLTPTGLKLIDSFMLTPIAKKYAIAKEICRADDYYPFSQFVALTVLAASYLTMIRTLNEKWNLSGRPLNIRVSIISLLLFGIYYLYELFVYVWSNGRDASADVKVLTWGRVTKSELNDMIYSYLKSPEFDREYLSGALEYYEKLIQRNIAIRELMRETSTGWTTAKERISMSGDLRGSVIRPAIAFTGQVNYIHDITGRELKKHKALDKEWRSTFIGQKMSDEDIYGED